MKIIAPILKARFYMYVLLLLTWTSCSDKKEEWLKNYSETKCAYQTVQSKIKADSIEQIPPLLSEREKLNEELIAIKVPFEKKIDGLNENISEEQKEYMKSYRKAEGEQSARFGHTSSPAYERIISELENKRDTKIALLQKQITCIKSEMESNEKYKAITEKIRLQDEKIKASQEGIIVKHKMVVDSLQEYLNLLNANYKNLKADQAPSEQKIFEQKRDSIRANPCK